LIEDENGQRPSGDVQSVLFREHMVGVSMSKNDARNVFLLLGDDTPAELNG